MQSIQGDKMIHNWIWWGLGWLFLPRMTIGLILGTILDSSGLALTLAIIGFILDMGSGTSSRYSK